MIGVGLAGVAGARLAGVAGVAGARLAGVAGVAGAGLAGVGVGAGAGAGEVTGATGAVALMGVATEVEELFAFAVGAGLGVAEPLAFAAPVGAGLGVEAAAGVPSFPGIAGLAPLVSWSMAAKATGITEPPVSTVGPKHSI